MIDTIVTDMDDTLLNEEGQLSLYTLEIVRECLKRGIRFIPSSGRAQASMEPYIRQLDTHLPYIACNGAQLVNADHSLMECQYLPADTARELCRFFDENGFYAQVYRDPCFYFAKDCEPSENYKHSSGMRGVAVGDLQSFLTFDTPKVLAVSTPQQVAALYPIAKERFGDSVCFTISKPYFLEVAPAEANKGAALKRLARRMGLKSENTMVFGDSLNDLSMLAFTENSVAMGNARDEVKAAAQYQCLPNGQDGVARYIEEKVLGRGITH